MLLPVILLSVQLNNCLFDGELEGKDCPDFFTACRLVEWSSAEHRMGGYDTPLRADTHDLLPIKGHGNHPTLQTHRPEKLPLVPELLDDLASPPLMVLAVDLLQYRLSHKYLVQVDLSLSVENNLFAGLFLLAVLRSVLLHPP